MATPYKTRDELVRQALAFLGKLDPGEAPAAEDASVVDGLIEPMMEQLSDEKRGVNLAAFDPDQIPNAVFLPLARLLANFSGPQIAATPMNTDAINADMATLARVLTPLPGYQIATGEYF